jgi:hypothetical protein
VEGLSEEDGDEQQADPPYRHRHGVHRQWMNGRESSHHHESLSPADGSREYRPHVSHGHARARSGVEDHRDPGDRYRPAEHSIPAEPFLTVSHGQTQGQERHAGQQDLTHPGRHLNQPLIDQPEPCSELQQPEENSP